MAPVRLIAIVSYGRIECNSRAGKGAVDFAEFMKMMVKNGPNTSNEIKETFAIFNASGR